MVRYLPFLISLGLTVYALFHCIQTKDEDVPNLPKLIWILLIVFVPFVGPITWILMERSNRRKREGGGGSPNRPAPRPTAPDDDPDFLRWLDRNRPDPPKDPDSDDPESGKR